MAMAAAYGCCSAALPPFAAFPRRTSVHRAHTPTNHVSLVGSFKLRVTAPGCGSFQAFPSSFCPGSPVPDLAPTLFGQVEGFLSHKELGHLGGQFRCGGAADSKSSLLLLYGALLMQAQIWCQVSNQSLTSNILDLNSTVARFIYLNHLTSTINFKQRERWSELSA
jgi:hypothetical protein